MLRHVFLKRLEAFQKHNDHDAFAEIFAPYERRVWRTIFAKSVPERDAEDVLQDVRLGVARFLARKAPDDLAAVVHTVTVRQIASYYRKRQFGEVPLFPEKGDGTSLGEEEGVRPHESLEERMTLEKVLRNKALSEKHKEVLQLHFQIGYSLDEVAKILSISKNTVKSRLLSGKDKLRAILGIKEGHDADS